LTTQSAEPQPEKVHVRGLDNFSTSDLKQWASEHFSLDGFNRVEWIDDTSANLSYNSAEAAQDALVALTDSDFFNMAAIDIPPLQLRPARRLSTHHTVELFVRQSTEIDTKQKGAREASRYYLLNPDQDPGERRKNDDHRRPRRRRLSDDGDYNRRRFDDREHKRRRDGEGFDASMYDDDMGEGKATDERRKRPRFGGGDDLFGDRDRRSNGRLRDRSASPTFDGDGTMGFGTDEDPTGRDRRRARQRSLSPHRPGSRNTGKELFSKTTSKSTALSNSNTPKELFPSKTQEPKELFSEKSPSTPAARELFPSKRQSFSNHRRTAAFDASGSGAGDFFASSTPPPPRERSLAERITGRPSTADANDMRIRGAETEGFSIRGAAQQSPSVKELFPLKAGANVGKELFGEKIKGRGAPRRKAEDMFS
jgi:hypothetical protein